MAKSKLHPLVKKAGFKSNEDFYKKFPTRELYEMAMGGVPKVFPQIQSEKGFFGMAHENVPAPYQNGSFKIGGYAGFGEGHPFPYQPRMPKNGREAYGRPNWPYFFAQMGGGNGVQEQNVYNSTMQAMGNGAGYRWPMASNAPGPMPMFSSPSYGGAYNVYSPPLASHPDDMMPYMYEEDPTLSPKKKQKGGPATINQGPEYFTNKQNEFTGWLRNQAMQATMKQMPGFMKNGGTGYPEMFPYAMPYTYQEGGAMQEEKWQAIVALTEQGITDPEAIAQELNTEGTYSTTPEEVQSYLQQYMQDASSEEYQMGGEGGPDMNPNAMNMINMYAGAYGQASEDADVNSGLMNFANAGIEGYNNMNAQPGMFGDSQSQDQQSGNPGLPPMPEYRKCGGAKMYKAQRGMQYNPGMIPSRMPGNYPDPGYYTNRVNQGSVYNYPMYGHTNLFPANFSPNARYKLKFQGKKIYMGAGPSAGSNQQFVDQGQYPGIEYGNPNIQKIKEYSNIFGSGRKVKFKIPYYGELPEEPKKERKSLKDFFKKKKGSSNALPETQYQEVPDAMPTSLAPANKEQWMKENSFPYTAPAGLAPGTQAFLNTQPEWVHQNLAGYQPAFGSSEVNPMTGAYMPPVNFGSSEEQQIPMSQNDESAPSSVPPGRGPLRERLARFLGVNTASGRYLEKHGKKMGGYYQMGGPYDYLKPDMSNMNPDLDPENLPGYMPPPTLTNSEMVQAIGDNPSDQVRTPTGYLTGKYKEHYGNGMNQEDMANWGIAGLGLLGNIASIDEKNDAEKQLRRKFKAENIFTSRQDRDRGDYTTNQGYFRPDQTVPVQFQGSKAGTYETGGEYELSDEEIQNILKNGGTVEFI